MSSGPLPTLTDGTYQYGFSTVLDGTTYFLSFYWVERTGEWFMTIADASENVLLAARKVVLGWAMISRFKIEGLPLGDFVAVDTSGTDTPPGLNDLGSRVLLFYISVADLPNLDAAARAALVAQGVIPPTA